MIAAVLLIGATIGFLVGGVFMAALSAGKNEDQCRACQREAILRACLCTRGGDERQDASDD